MVATQCLLVHTAIVTEITGVLGHGVRCEYKVVATQQLQEHLEIE